jgi:hypothetical protein
MYLHSDDPPVTACSPRSPAGNEKQAADHLISRHIGTLPRSHLSMSELSIYHKLTLISLLAG